MQAIDEGSRGREWFRKLALSIGGHSVLLVYRHVLLSPSAFRVSLVVYGLLRLKLYGLRSPAEAMRFGVESRLVRRVRCTGHPTVVVDSPADTPAVLRVS